MTASYIHHCDMVAYTMERESIENDLALLRSRQQELDTLLLLQRNENQRDHAEVVELLEEHGEIYATEADANDKPGFIQGIAMKIWGMIKWIWETLVKAIKKVGAFISKMIFQWSRSFKDRWNDVNDAWKKIDAAYLKVVVAAEWKIMKQRLDAYRWIADYANSLADNCHTYFEVQANSSGTAYASMANRIGFFKTGSGKPGKGGSAPNFLDYTTMTLSPYQSFKTDLQAAFPDLPFRFQDGSQTLQFSHPDEVATEQSLESTPWGVSDKLTALLTDYNAQLTYCNAKLAEVDGKRGLIQQMIADLNGKLSAVRTGTVPAGDVVDQDMLSGELQIANAINKQLVLALSLYTTTTQGIIRNDIEHINGVVSKVKERTDRLKK